MLNVDEINLTVFHYSFEEIYREISLKNMFSYQHKPGKFNHELIFKKLELYLANTLLLLYRKSCYNKYQMSDFWSNDNTFCRFSQTNKLCPVQYQYIDFIRLLICSVIPKITAVLFRKRIWKSIELSNKCVVYIKYQHI